MGENNKSYKKVESALAEKKRQAKVDNLDSYASKTNQTKKLKPSQDGNKQSPVGNWEPNSTGLGYHLELHYIQYKLHFDWLRNNQQSFISKISDPVEIVKILDSVDAIKGMFVEQTFQTCASLVSGLNSSTMELVLGDTIGPLTDNDANDYHSKPKSRVIFLVDNYDPNSRSARGVGAIMLWWDLRISRTGKSQDHQYLMQLTIHSRSMLYSSVERIKDDYDAVLKHFHSKAFLAITKNSSQPDPSQEKQVASPGIPSKETKIETFTTRPPSTKETFMKSLPKVANQQSLQVIVLYAPDLDLLKSIDNTRSDITTSYQKSVTSGFTFSMTQQLNILSKLQISAIITSVTNEINLSFSFTETWSKSTTETISFLVPGRKKGYAYQGCLKAQILEFDPEKHTFTFKETAQLLSNSLVTSENRLVNPDEVDEIVIVQ